MENNPLLGNDNERKHISVYKRIVQNGEIDHVDVIARPEKRNEFTVRLAIAITACTFGSSFQFGYNTGIVNAPAKVLKQFYNQSACDQTLQHGHCIDEHNNQTGHYLDDNTLTTLWAVTVAMFAIGGMLGGLSAGYWADLYGRKKTLLLNNILMVVAVTVEILSKFIGYYQVLIVGRLLIGINAGINTGIAPMYLSEIAPVSLRGFCGTLNQLCITFGVFMSTILGLDNVLGTRNYWHLAVGFPLVMVVWQLGSLTFCPESPRYLLIAKNSEEEAERALIWLRGTVDVADEIDEMISERDLTKGVKKFSVRDLIHSHALRSPLIICIMMHLSQQLSGINAVIYYSTSIFESASLSLTNAQYATLGTGAVNVCMTFVSALIMDRLGRRTLHLIGLGGMFISSIILTAGLLYEDHHSNATGVDYLCVVAVVCYIMSFASGPGSIPWFFTAELFSQAPRPAAVSIGVLVNWAANFTVGLVFPFLQIQSGGPSATEIQALYLNQISKYLNTDKTVTFLSEEIANYAMDKQLWNLSIAVNIKAYSFIPFVVFLGIFWLYTYRKVPETKGRKIEHIVSLFRETNADHLAF